MVKVSFIGCGSIGSVHVQAVQMCNYLGVVAGGADPDSRQRDAFIARTNAPAFADFCEMLDHTRPDAVVISSPPNVRCDVIQKCIEREIAVLCEKPLAINTVIAKQIVELAALSKKICAVGFCHRYNSAVCIMKEMLQNGDLGDPIEFINFFAGFAPQLADTWRTDTAVSGGGNLFDNGTHSIDLFRFFFGDIQTAAGTTRHMWPGRGEDSGFVMLTSHSGVVGQITTSWIYPYNASTIEIVGTKGAVRFSYDAIDELKTCNIGGTWKTMKISEDRRFVNQMKDFLKAVKGNPPQKLASFEDGLIAIEVIEQACKNKLDVNKNN